LQLSYKLSGGFPLWRIDADQGGGLGKAQHFRVLTLEDCIGLCGLTEDEVRAIAQHEGIPEIAAAELGNYLVSSPDGELFIKEMIRDDLAHACGSGNRKRELALKLVLRKFILQHPRCDERHRSLLQMPDRRLAGEDAG